MQLSQSTRDPDDEDRRTAIILKGDREAAFVLLGTYTDYLHSYVYSQYSWIDEEDIEDIVGSALVDIFAKRDRYDPTKASLKTWLVKTTHFHTLRFVHSRKHLRSNQRAKGTPVELADEPGDDEIVNNTDDITMIAATSELELPDKAGLSLEVGALFQQISPKRAEAIRRRYYGGEPDSQIAMQMHITESSVRSLVKRGLDDIRKLLK